MFCSNVELFIAGKPSFVVLLSIVLLVFMSCYPLCVTFLNFYCFCDHALSESYSGTKPDCPEGGGCSSVTVDDSGGEI
ncbi:hypothetical protein L1987_11908 [Smallanthus sonchifolius]|uniref:Uncharacterized protein n=1 Tax=Smallanthus sonchifolius TaxID=185202 RepID=A0ACB9JEX7_9ASTR|nr:hypothetical protein L1987_11908 [Smallanthus sonchifolius]